VKEADLTEKGYLLLVIVDKTVRVSQDADEILCVLLVEQKDITLLSS
jgi:hypothetical protein